MRIAGINCLSHDASACIVQDGKVLYYDKGEGHYLHNDLVYTLKYFGPSMISFFERPWVKKSRQIYSGQYAQVLTQTPASYLKSLGFDLPIVYQNHHKSHAAAGYFNSKYESAAIVVADAIGEWTCTSIWHAKGNDLRQVYNVDYPHSLGLFYSAFTDLLGFEPNSEEYKFYQLAQEGDPSHYYSIVNGYFKSDFHLRYNLHTRITDWPFAINEINKKHIAASVQKVFCEKIDLLFSIAKQLTGERNVVFMGGCAANKLAADQHTKHFDNLYSYDKVGDAGSSVGAALLIGR